MKNYNAISLIDFSFIKEGYGCYHVQFTSRNTLHSWNALVTDMTLIDATKNAEKPKRADLVALRNYCKQHGNRYDRHGNRI